MSRHGFEKMVKIPGTDRVQWVLDEEKARKTWEENATVDAKDIVRWRSNGSVPFDDVLADFQAVGFKFDFAASQAARERDTAKFVAAYRKAQKNRPVSAEERFEAGAAFGRDVEVVDVISGRKFRT